MATRGKMWTDDEVQVMLGIWGEASIQRQLKGAVRNVHVFDKIVKELDSKGFKRDEKQCREKLLLTLKFCFHSSSLQPLTTSSKKA